MSEIVMTREQVRRVDELAVQQLGISSLVLMENAGRGVADTLCRLGISGTVSIWCGKGNNAGDGFVLARHLELRGYTVEVLLCFDPSELRGDAEVNYRILQHGQTACRRLAEVSADELTQMAASADWIVDGLLGTGVRGAPRSPLDDVIRAMNAAPARRLALDVPSGLDCDTGQPSATTVRAEHTCTFVASKPGYQQPAAGPYLGMIHVLDIGLPLAWLTAAGGA